MSRAESHRVGIEYPVTGEGPLVLLLHGFPDTGRLGRYQAPTLAGAGSQVIVADLCGYGRSGKPEAVEGYALPILAGDVIALVIDLGLAKAHVAGNAWGAAPAWALASSATAFAENAGALPCLVLRLAAATGGMDLRQAPGDRQKASVCRVRAQEIAGRLGAPALETRLAAAPSQWSLRRDGEDWLLQAGPEQARLRDSRGLHYLRALLAAPGSEIPALDLVADGPGLTSSSTGPLLDATARNSYRQRIRELNDDLAAADRTGDITAAEKAHLERQALIGELRRATGLAGRPRHGTADAERARVNVTRTLRATIDRITRVAPIAGAHLGSSIRTGTACRYQPAPGGPARWHT